MTSDSSITVTYISQEEQADPEHIHQAFLNTRYLPHVVNGQFEGGNARTTFVLFNPGDISHSMILSLTKDDGSPLDVNIPEMGGQGNHFGGLLRPGETQIVQTGRNIGVELRSSYCNCHGADWRFRHFLYFRHHWKSSDRDRGGKPGTAVDVVIPVDSRGQFDTRLALFNSKSNTAFVEFQLLDESGRKFPQQT